MGLMKELNDLNNIYQNMYSEDENKGYVVTNADKKGNTPAWQGYKAGKKKKDGKPMYRAADHLKNEELEVEGYEATKKKEVLGAMKKQGRKLSDKEKNKIADKVVKDKGDTSKSDDRYAYEEVSPELTKLIESGKFSEQEISLLVWNEFDEGYQRDPEKGEAAAKKADKRSAKEKRMADPEKGINSPAFQQFMRDRGLA